MRKRLQRLWQNTGDQDLSLWWAKMSVVLGGASVILLACVGLWAITTIPRWQVNEVPLLVLKNDEVKRFELENEARKTLSQIVLGAFGLVALFFTWRRVRAGDRNVRVIEQGHITDRYTKAIEQLGKLDEDKPNIEVRLGAIYALERIAFDSTRDHWTIMEVLTAYVRQNAPNPSNATGPTQQDLFASTTTTAASERPRTDIQAILTVLGRRKRGSKREREGQTLDLIRSNLSRANLDQVNLQRANLDQVNLQRANLCQANLQGAILIQANLQGAILIQANLQGTDLQGAKGLTVEQIKTAKKWQDAIYDPEFRQALELSIEREEVPNITEER